MCAGARLKVNLINRVCQSRYNRTGEHAIKAKSFDRLLHHNFLPTNDVDALLRFIKPLAVEVVDGCM